MLDRDIDGPVSRFAPLLPLSNAAIDPSGPCALHIIRSSRPLFPPHPLVHYIRIYIYMYICIFLSFFSSKRRFFLAEKSWFDGERGFRFTHLFRKW